MMTQRRIIALTGLSGAGKSTLIQSVSKHVDIGYLSASDLIKGHKRNRGTDVTSEGLRTGDILGNQTQLVEAFHAEAAAIRGHLILDCHTVIDTPAGLQRIPAETFQAIGVSDIIFLKVDVDVLVKRRKLDANRLRPERTPADLSEHQSVALDASREIAEMLGIHLVVLESEAEKTLTSFLKSLPTTMGGK